MQTDVTWSLVLTGLVMGAVCACIVGCGVSVDGYGALTRELQSNQPENLSLSFEKCSEPGPFFEAYVEKTEWLEDDVFYGLVAIPANCSDDYWVGNYRIENGDELVLEYTTIRAGGEDACLCRAELEYRITGLEKRDYSIRIHQADVLVP